MIYFKGSLQITAYPSQIESNSPTVPKPRLPGLLNCIQSVNLSLTHLFTEDLVVATQSAGGGSADLSSSI